MKEQVNGYVCLDGTLRQLPILNAWVGSSSVYWIVPSCGVASMSMKIGLPDMSGYRDAVKMQFHESRGMWRAYVPRSFFTRRCETRYKIVSVDIDGNRHVEGQGILRVYSDPISDGDDGDIDVTNAYLPMPDGTWRKLTIAPDEAGELTYRVGDAVLERRDFDCWVPKALFAYDVTTGLYHEVKGYVDASGTASITVGEESVEEGTETFVKDETSGLYRRIEATTDEVGELIIKTGETA